MPEVTAKESGGSLLAAFAAYGRALAARDVEACVACFAPEAVVRVVGAPHVPFVGQFEGHGAIREFFQSLLSLTEPDAAFVPPPAEVVERDDHIVIFSGFRHLVKATGRYYSGDFALHCVFREGLIARYQIYENSWSIGQAFDPLT